MREDQTLRPGDVVMQPWTPEGWYRVGSLHFCGDHRVALRVDDRVVGAHAGGAWEGWRDHG